MIVCEEEKRDIWIIADTHIGHTNIIKYCGRPYNSVSEMNDDIIKKWNSKIKTTAFSKFRTYPNLTSMDIYDFPTVSQSDSGAIVF